MHACAVASAPTAASNTSWSTVWVRKSCRGGQAASVTRDAAGPGLNDADRASRTIDAEDSEAGRAPTISARRQESVAAGAGGSGAASHARSACLTACSEVTAAVATSRSSSVAVASGTAISGSTGKAVPASKWAVSHVVRARLKDRLMSSTLMRHLGQSQHHLTPPAETRTGDVVETPHRRAPSDLPKRETPAKFRSDSHTVKYVSPLQIPAGTPPRGHKTPGQRPAPVTKSPPTRQTPVWVRLRCSRNSLRL